jgi:PKD repeat protein
VIAPSIAPTAAFAMSDVTPPLGVNVNFTDQSVGGTTGWLWYFGDGDTARSQNPHHAYSTGGAYTVTLISFQCSESDTISHTVTVQAAPQISVTPAIGFTASVQCGDSATFPLNVSNVAGGQLVYNTNGASVGKIRVLAMSYGTDPFSEFPHTVAAINHYFSNDTIITTSTTDPGVLSGLLVGKNVLLIPEQESGSPGVWTNLGPVIQQYLNNGGSVIFCGSNSSEANCMFNTGVFSGTFSQNAQNQTVDILLPADSLVKGITGGSFNAPSATYTMQITNTDKVKVVDFNGDDVVTYRHYGAGKAIFIGFDYFDSIPESGKIIANAIEWGGKNALPTWIHITPSGDTVNAGATTNGTVTFVAGGFPAGTYYANIGVASNDPTNPVVLVPCI